MKSLERFGDLARDHNIGSPRTFASACVCDVSATSLITLLAALLVMWLVELLVAKSVALVVIFRICD